MKAQCTSCTSWIIGNTGTFIKAAPTTAPVVKETAASEPSEISEKSPDYFATLSQAELEVRRVEDFREVDAT